MKREFLKWERAFAKMHPDAFAVVAYEPRQYLFAVIFDAAGKRLAEWANGNVSYAKTVH